MAEDNKKSAYKNVLEALSRTQKRYEGAKERIETVATEGMRTVVVGVVGFGAGLADQLYGEVDRETGLRSHNTNGAPTALLGAAVVKGAALFGLFGKAEQIGFAAGDGALGHCASTFGRQAGERLRIAQEKGKAKELPQSQVAGQVNGKTEAPSQALATAPTAQKAAV